MGGVGSSRMTRTDRRPNLGSETSAAENGFVCD
jgi:hypothetical protein